MAHKKTHRIGRWLEQLSTSVSKWAGRSPAFGLACGVVVVWALTGPFFGYSDTWQLVINTGTTVVTFLMVFLIQRAQNKDALAIVRRFNSNSSSDSNSSNNSNHRCSTRSQSNRASEPVGPDTVSATRMARSQGGR